MHLKSWEALRINDSRLKWSPYITQIDMNKNKIVSTNITKSYDKLLKTKYDISGRGAHVYLWWIHFDIWQNQYNYVKFKNKIKLKKTKTKTKYDT